jgi:hypothetical protein
MRTDTVPWLEHEMGELEIAPERVRVAIEQMHRETAEQEAIRDALWTVRDMGLFAFVRLYLSHSYWSWWYCVDMEQEREDDARRRYG